MSNSYINNIAKKCNKHSTSTENVECISEPTLFDVSDSSNCNCNTLENLSQSSRSSGTVEDGIVVNSTIISRENLSEYLENALEAFPLASSLSVDSVTDKTVQLTLDARDGIEFESDDNGTKRAGVNNIPQNLRGASNPHSHRVTLTLDERCFEVEENSTELGHRLYIDTMTFVGKMYYSDLVTLLNKFMGIVQPIGENGTPIELGHKTGKWSQYPGQSEPFTDIVENAFRSKVLWCHIDNPEDLTKDKRLKKDENGNYKGVNCVTMNAIGRHKECKPKMKCNVRVQLTGKFLEALGMDARYEARLIRWFYEMGLHCTRLDLALTDYQKMVNWSQLFEAIENGNYAHFQKCSYHFSQLDGLSGQFPTIYLGTRRSECFVRIYDTFPNHEFKAIRYELQLSGQKSDHFCRGFINPDNPAQNHIGLIQFYTKQENNSRNNADDLNWAVLGFYQQILFGNLAFIDKSKVNATGSTKNCPLLDWWESFKARCNIHGTIKLRHKQEKPSMVRTLKHIKKCWANTLTMLKRGLPEQFYDFLDGIIRENEESGRYARACNSKPILQSFEADLKKRGLVAIYEAMSVCAI